MGVKISELPVASSANNNDSLVLNHGSETQRITLEKLMESGKRAAILHFCRRIWKTMCRKAI